MGEVFEQVLKMRTAILQKNINKYKFLGTLFYY